MTADDWSVVISWAAILMSVASVWVTVLNMRDLRRAMRKIKDGSDQNV